MPRACSRPCERKLSQGTGAAGYFILVTVANLRARVVGGRFRKPTMDLYFSAL